MFRIRQQAARAATAFVAIVAAISLTAPTALAAVCFTSGKVYIQQKVYDKAARFLECARHEEPDNLQIYGLLAFARAQLREYRSAGAAFQIGVQMATKKNDDKRLKELKQNRDAALGGLFNKGIAAMNRAGHVQVATDRTTDAETPQGKVEKEKGAPADFAKWSEAGGSHEIWYYPKENKAYYFPPTGEAATVIDTKPFNPSLDLQSAVADSTVSPDYDGASKFLEAVYNFELAALIDPTYVDTYKNLSYLYEQVGRIDDAIVAAKTGLQLKPGDDMLTRNLRAAAMGRGNRLYAEGKYKESVKAYWPAMETDLSNRVIYLDRISEAWLKYAESLDKANPERAAAYDSASTNYTLLYSSAPDSATGERQNAIFNAAVIATRLDNYKKASELLDKGITQFPNNADLQSLAGQTKYQAQDYAGAVLNLRKAVELNAKDPTNHQFLFLTLLKLGKKEESAAEYAMYKALSGGKQRVGNDLKVWVDAADNRLGPSNQLKVTVKAEGYPDEVYSYTDDAKTFESWFYWGKGKAITFMEGQVFSKGTFPAQKTTP